MKKNEIPCKDCVTFAICKIEHDELSKKYSFIMPFVEKRYTLFASWLYSQYNGHKVVTREYFGVFNGT